MTMLSRRRFLAASAASAASAGTSAIAATGDFDVVIIGAGAAGIAAARRLAGTRAKIALLEASGRLGGRCVTGRPTLRGAFDRRAHRVPNAELHPGDPLGLQDGFDGYSASA